MTTRADASELEKGAAGEDTGQTGEGLAFDLGWIARSTGRAERRQVVVLAIGFDCAPSSDPEVIVEVLAQRRSFVAGIVTRFGGTVGRVDPDLQIVAWGWSISGEADTRLAVTAALEIAACGDHCARCGVDAGIAVTAEVADPFAGLGFVGDMVAGAIYQQGSARTGQVSISEAVRSLVGDAFELSLDDTLGTRTKSWTVRRRLAMGRRQRPKPEPVVELAGREAETTQLEEIWQRVVAGTPEIVAIEGEAGIGKSALLRWLDHRAADVGSRSVHVHCLPENRHVPFEPLGVLVDMLARLPAPLPVHRELRHGLIDPEPYIGDVEGARLIERCRQLLDQSEPGADCLHSAVLDLASYKAAARPLLVAVEDLQWADECTLRMISGTALGRQCRGHLLFVFTRRSGPSCEPLAADAEGWWRLSLGRLSSRHIENILESGDPASLILDEQRRRIVSMADGNPFHALELARIAGSAEIASPYRRLLAGPNRLNSGLAERLDALAELKPLAQAAAVLGRQFDARVLAEALEMETRSVCWRLETLVRMGILARSRSERVFHYRFQDALLWTQAYGSVLRSRRRAFHLKIASVLDGPLGLEIGVVPGVLATHWKRAGKPHRSFSWWLEAAKDASEKGAAALAVSFTNQALCAARSAPEVCSPHQEATLMNILGAQLRALGGGGSIETVAAYERAMRLVSEMAAKPGDIDLDVAWGIAAIHLVRGEVHAAADASGRLMSDATERGRDDILLLSLRLHGTSRLLLGFVAEAVAMLSSAASRYDRQRHGWMFRRYVTDPGASALAHLASAAAIAGKRDVARDARRRALELAADIGHSHTTANVMGVLALSAMNLDEHGTAVALSRAAERIACEHGHAYWQVRSRLILAWHEARSDAREGIDFVCSVLDEYNNIGSGRATAFAACLAAEIAILAGQPRRALELLAPVRMRGRINGEWIYVPEIKRLEATALAQSGRPGDFEAALALLAQGRALAIDHGSTVFLGRIEKARAEIEAENGRLMGKQAKSPRRAGTKSLTRVQ